MPAVIGSWQDAHDTFFSSSTFPSAPFVPPTLYGPSFPEKPPIEKQLLAQSSRHHVVFMEIRGIGGRAWEAA